MALLVVLVAMGSALYFSGGLPFLGPRQAEKQPLSRNVRLVPKAADGSMPLHYFVRIKRAVDTTGGEIDVSSAPVIEVSGDGGFNPGDLIAGLPEGSHTFEIEIDEETFELPSLDLAENGEGESGEAFEVGPYEEAPAAEEDVPQTADEWFLDKIEELQDSYGMQAIQVVENPRYPDYHLAYASGLAFAELIDFGDGVERLVVIYYVGSTSDTPRYSDYYLEI